METRNRPHNKGNETVDNTILSAKYNAEHIAQSLIIAYWVESKSTKAFQLTMAIEQMEKLIADMQQIKLALESESL